MKESSKKKSAEKISLFHGSGNGIHGIIAPISRGRSDFGAGFYMAPSALHPLRLVCSGDSPVLYEVELDTKGLNVLELKPDLTWALVIAFNRGKLEPYRDFPVYTAFQALLAEIDLIRGVIADDQAFVLLDRFFQGEITDQALIHCLSRLDLGIQYAAVSEKACRQITITSARTIAKEEREQLKTLSEQNRQAGIDLVKTISREYRRKGRFFDEIVEDWNGFEMA